MTWGSLLKSSHATPYSVSTLGPYPSVCGLASSRPGYSRFTLNPRSEFSLQPYSMTAAGPPESTASSAALASDLAEALPDVAARASWGMKPPAATAPPRRGNQTRPPEKVAPRRNSRNARVRVARRVRTGVGI